MGSSNNAPIRWYCLCIRCPDYFEIGTIITVPKFIYTVLIKNKTNSNFHLGELCLKLIHVNTMASAVDMRVESGRIFPYEREADNCTPCPQ